jgi:hypothetical protein
VSLGGGQWLAAGGTRSVPRLDRPPSAAYDPPGTEHLAPVADLFDDDLDVVADRLDAAIESLANL